MKRSSPLSRIVSIIHRLEDVFLSLLLLALIVISFSQIAGRLFLNTGITGIDPILYHLVLWIGLMGAAVATREKEHITIDIITRFVSGRTKQLIQIFTNLFSATICSILMWAGFRFVMEEADAGSKTMNVIPAWILQLVIPASMAIIALRFVIEALIITRGLFRKAETE